MTKPASPPDEATLRRFLLGTLPPDDADRVAKWVMENPGAAVVLRDIDARDTVVDAIGEGGTAQDTSSAPQSVHTLVQVVTPATSHPFAVGGFHVIRKIGQGGMGVVLEAEDTHLKRLVAIKLIASEYAANAAARERFLRKARAVARIEHENVVPILHVGEDAGQLYLVMPLLKGETLDARLLRDKRLPVDELLRIGREVAAGLAAAHAVGLVHRDVKPANIWLEAGTGRVKLLDFGLAKPTEESETDANLTDPGAVMGTVYYMAPEQAEGKSVDSRTDLFSFGAVLYHAATGERPFKGDTKLAVLIAVTSATPPRAEELNTDVPPRLAALLRALLEKNPKDRPDSATAVISELQDAPTPAPKAEPVRSARSPRWAIAAGLLAAVVFVAAVVVIIRDKDGKEVARIEVPKDGSVEVTPDKKGGDSGKPPAPVVADPDRKAAEWALSINGIVRVNDEVNDIKAAADLPKEPFRLTCLILMSNERVDAAGLAHCKGCANLTYLNLQFTPATDAGLAPFEGCKTVTHLALGKTQVTDVGLGYFKECRTLSILGLFGTKVTDAGLAHFAGCKTLTHLAVGDTQVGDAGLEHFNKCEELTELYLRGTRVTNEYLSTLKKFKRLRTVELWRTQVNDVGLAHLKDCTNLAHLDLKATKVTAAGVAACAKALPTCRIEWDGGVVEPISDSDRKAAEYVLSVDGTVNVNRGDKALQAVTDLPKDRFDLTAADFQSNTKVTDAGLAAFSGCKNLTDLNLSTCRAVSDIGLAHFKDCTNLLSVDVSVTRVTDTGIAGLAANDKLFRLTANLTDIGDTGLAAFEKHTTIEFLYLNDTKLTDASLKRFAAFKRLSVLQIDGTAVTDAGLAALAGNAALRGLDVRKTKVTAKGVAALAKARPQCQIQWDGGTIEPKK